MPSSSGVGGPRVPTNIQTFSGDTDKLIQQWTAESKKSGGTQQQQASGDQGATNNEGRTAQQQAMHEQLSDMMLTDMFSRIQQMKNQPTESDDEITKAKKSRMAQMQQFFQLGGPSSSSGNSSSGSDAETVSASRLTAANGGTRA